MMLSMMMIGFALVVAVFLLAMFAYGASTATGKAKREPVMIAPDMLNDATLLADIDAGQKIQAIKYYREVTGASLKASKEAVELIIEHRDDLDQLAKAKGRLLDELPVGDGVRHLIEDGEIERAVAAYRDFNGVDEFTARDAVEALRAQMDTDESTGHATHH